MQKNKKRIMIAISVLACVLLVGIAGVGFGANYLYNLAINPSTSKDLIFGSEEESDENAEAEDTIAQEELDKLDRYYSTSRDGLKLCNYVLSGNDSNKWVITVHGYTSEGKKMYSYAKKFFELGYNVIIPDLRGHGESEGEYIGMGWDDRLDIIDLINGIVENYPDSEIVLFGVSMGAATVLNVSGESIPSNVKAVIEDCGFTSVWDEFSYQLKELFGLPSFPMMHSASLVTKLRAGYWFGEASVIEQVKKSVTPTLFIHGDADTFVPYFMLDELYNASTAEKEKLVIEGAAHAKASTVNPTLYWETIEAFLAKY